jgi:hypothetical protein
VTAETRTVKLTRSQRLELFRRFVAAHADELGIDATSIRNPRPGVVSALTDTGAVFHLAVDEFEMTR